MPTDPLWLPTLGYTEDELRKMDSALLMADGTALGSRPGIRPGDPGLAVTLSGAAVNVSAGTASLYRPGQGVYRAQMPATTPGTLAAAHTTWSRIDLVYLRVWDTSVDGSGQRKADTVLLPGTASATPSAPTPAPTEIYVPLATITVPSTGGGGTGAATVSSAVRQLTVAPGGILPVSSAADIAIAGSYSGQARFNTLRMQPEYWNGVNWAAQGDYTNVTPAWTASVTNPSLGNGTLLSRWARVGRKISWMGTLILGSTSNGGTGIWSLSLPVQAASTGILQLGVADYVNAGDNEYQGETQITSGAFTAGFIVKTSATSASTGNISNTVPVAASSNTRLHWNIDYEAAS
ncbi:hypothetical protein [Kitasatospora sp. NPDC127116]|uniref:hypothetical protein n=1 Tax=Kitasatospora sp. NPDC127116 TaxID=3345367 RepID=UPI003645EBC9